MSTANRPVLNFSASLAAHFYRLNAEWLQRHFTFEPIDAQILGDPMQHIIEPGGHILFAEQNFEIVGTCALIPERAGSAGFELAKMGVTLN